MDRGNVCSGGCGSPQKRKVGDFFSIHALGRMRPATKSRRKLDNLKLQGGFLFFVSSASID